MLSGKNSYCKRGGGTGIRTLDTLADKPPFQDGAIDQLGDPSILGYFNRDNVWFFYNLLFLGVRASPAYTS